MEKNITARSDNIGKLYVDHIARQNHLMEKFFSHFGLAYLLIASGNILSGFKDDITYPFKVNPYFKQWLPLTEGANSYLLLTPNAKPTLFLYQPDDFWHKWPSLTSCDWLAEESICTEFSVINIKATAEITKYLKGLDSIYFQGAFIGPKDCLHSDFPAMRINDDSVLNYMNYHRCYKTPYEMQCLYQANIAATSAHHKAFSLFKAGATEAEVFWGYLQAGAILQPDNPYEPIIAYNQHAALLHYFSKSRQLPAEGIKSMLIDAGVSFAGYGSDISRTYSYQDDEFADLIAQFDRLHLNVVSGVKIGATFSDLYEHTYRAIADFMCSNQFVKCSAEAVYEKGLVKYFFPNGLGHMLGAQVHDLGQNLHNAFGERVPPVPAYPKHGNRIIESGMVLTIEPGFYFMEAPLELLKASEYASLINWDMVNRFRPYGGIRIEDNIAMVNGAAVNITREVW